MVAAARHRHKQSRSRHVRKETWRAENPDGRRRCFTYRDREARQDESRHLLVEGQEPGGFRESAGAGVLAQEIADDLQTALEQFSAIASELK
jgi:type I restriction enzyme M protein